PVGAVIVAVGSDGGSSAIPRTLPDIELGNTGIVVLRAANAICQPGVLAFERIQSGVPHGDQLRSAMWRWSINRPDDLEQIKQIIFSLELQKRTGLGFNNIRLAGS